MKININNPIITFSERGKAFAYTRLFYAVLNKYIMEYKNCRLELLTENDVAACMQGIFNKMEVNGVPVMVFFSKSLDSWKDLTENEKIRKLTQQISKDIFCCFDKNLYDENNSFAKSDRIYCINNNGEKDYIYCEEYEKKGLFSKKLTPESQYFKELMKKNNNGELPLSE